MSEEVTLLGPVALTHPAEGLGGPKASAVFALLALSAGSVVSNNELIDGVWEDLPPDSVSATLQAYISRLRKICRERGHNIERTGSGYQLEMPRSCIDAHLLADELAAAERTVSPNARAVLLEGIGPMLGDEPLGGCPSSAALDMARRQLNALQLTAVQLFATTALSVELEMTPSAVRIADRNPTAEAAQAALCTLLWNRGRTAEARQRVDWVIDHSRSALGQEPSHVMLRLDEQLNAGGPATLRVHPVEPRSDTVATPTGRGNSPGGKLVGRADERRVLQDAVSGTGAAAVLVTGEGGIGKSTLVRTSLPRSQWAPAPVVGATPWPWIWELFGFKPPSIDAQASLYEVLDASTRAIQDGLRHETKPRILVVDDLHNRSTVAQLQFAALARELDDTNLSLIGISRDELPELTIEKSNGAPAPTHISLAPLSSADALTLVSEQLSTDDPRVPQLVQNAGGLPLLLTRGIQLLADQSTDSPTSREGSDINRRVLGLVALARSVGCATLAEVLGPETLDALEELAADGQLVIDADVASFSHDRLAEAAQSEAPTAQEIADRRCLASILLDRWDGTAQSAVALSDLLGIAEIPTVQVHLAAAGAHQGARDWQAAAMATERAANDLDSADSADDIIQLAAERWIRAGDLWRARELLAPGVDQVMQQLDPNRASSPDRLTDLGLLVEYISYGTTGFRIDDRVRHILEQRPRDSSDEPRSLMLEAVELTEIRRGSIRAVPQAASADELLARARILGDPRAITWALGPTLVDALNADDHQQLSSLADELAANAAGPEQAEVPVVAGWYRYEAALRRGDSLDAERHLADIEHQARTTMEVPSRWYANTLRAGRLIGEGRFDDAERCLRTALELGAISIGSEAYASYGAGLLMIRWFQDRSTELLAAAPPRLADSPVGAPSLGIVFGALIRSLVPSSADRRELTAVVPHASNSLEHALVAEAALATNDQTTAREILAVFRPQSPMVAMPAGLYVSAAESVRGRLLALIGDTKAAAPALARGAAIELGAGAVLANKRTTLAHAAVLVADGARSEGSQKAAAVEHWSRSNGIQALERQAVELRAKSSLG